MKRTHLKGALYFAAFLILILATSKPFSSKAQAAGSGAQPLPVVRAVMFWMEGCPHCHYVLEEVLPPLHEKYGDQLQIQLIELATAEDVDRLYQTAAAFNIPKEQVGVPFLVIGDRVLTGSDQIPSELPELIEKHLASGGLDYPNVPGLAEIIPTNMPETEADACPPLTPCAGEITPESETMTPVAIAAAVESQPNDALAETVPKPNGFAIAISVMVGMVASFIYAGARFIQGSPRKTVYPRPKWLDYATLVLAVLGLSVAVYLAYVETQAVSAVCGPVGDCNAVQSSPFAKLFGVLPVGVLGIIGYVAILLAWAYSQLKVGLPARYASLAVFGLSVFGVFFSLYLTYLEPFIIKAVCIWCLTSAVIMTLLLLIGLKPAIQAFEELQE